MVMKLVIVEDDKLLLENLSFLLQGEPEIEVEGAFLTAEEALLEFDRIQPDILLADLKLPGISGIDLIKIIKTRYPNTDIIAHTVFVNESKIFSAIKAGSCGYLLKGLTTRELVENLRHLHNGGALMNARIARSIINEFRDENGINPNPASPWEMQILQGLEKGLTYNELSENLNISCRTVYIYIKNIYQKLHDRNRSETHYRSAKKSKLTAPRRTELHSLIKNIQ
ncbi:response regulator transcription factor [bacterium]|nr:response regulator transcription factor [bacterium]